jgi:hypothetical protein
MARKWLKTSISADVVACNRTPYGYPAKGVPLLGGVVSESNGVGWTAEEFPVEDAFTGVFFVVEVDDSKVPPALVSALVGSKPAVKANK